MKRFLLVLVMAAAIFAAPTTASADDNPFIGVWQGTDSSDGSLMTFTVRGHGESVKIGLGDEYASGCVLLGAPADKPQAMLKGSGAVSGSTMTITFTTFRCHGFFVPQDDGPPGTAIYDATTDTIATLGETWHRLTHGGNAAD